MAPVASATSDDEGVVATSVAGRGGVMVRAWHVCPLMHQEGRAFARPPFASGAKNKASRACAACLCGRDLRARLC